MLYNKLTEQDRNIIEYYIQNYGNSCNANTVKPMASLEHILRFWNQNKAQYLYQAFGNQFIVEKEIEYCEPEQSIRSNLQNSLSFGAMHNFRDKAVAIIYEEFSWYSDERTNLLYLFESRCLANNTADLSCNTLEVEFSNGNKIKLVHGAKTIKLLSKLAKALNLEAEFEQFRLEHSRFLNQKKVAGTLCLSIHPLDYMTMSDNCSDWSSCMSWMDDGSYRMGTVEMMNSPMVVVAYIKNHKDFNFGPYTWNNKKWRSLFIVDPQLITSIKAYPYQNKELTTICLEWLRELVNTNNQWHFNSPVIDYKDSTHFKYKTNTYHIAPECGRMYNDFGTVDHYCVLPDREEWDKTYVLNLYYSGETECMNCGGTNYFFDEENFVFCEDCSDGGEYYSSCEHCGRQCPEDELVYIDGCGYCSDCLSEVAEECSFSGDWCFKETLVDVYLARVSDAPNPATDKHLRVHEDYISAYAPYGLKSKAHYSDELDIFYWNTEDIQSGSEWLFGFNSTTFQDYINPNKN